MGVGSTTCARINLGATTTATTEGRTRVGVDRSMPRLRVRLPVGAAGGVRDRTRETARIYTRRRRRRL